MDRVSPETALAVLTRDQGCIAVRLGADPAGCRSPLTLDHVKDQPNVGDPIVKRGKARRHSYRAPSDAAHLVSICAGHHLDNGWATSHRPELRLYLASVA